MAVVQASNERVGPIGNTLRLFAQLLHFHTAPLLSLSFVEPLLYDLYDSHIDRCVISKMTVWCIAAFRVDKLVV